MKEKICYYRQKEFMEYTGQFKEVENLSLLYRNLILEEKEELIDAINNNNIELILDSVADLVVVISGFLLSEETKNKFSVERRISSIQHNTELSKVKVIDFLSSKVTLEEINLEFCFLELEKLLTFCYLFKVNVKNLLNETYDSNFTKFSKLEDGSYLVSRNSEGKILKDKGYTPADFCKFINIDLIDFFLPFPDRTVDVFNLKYVNRFSGKFSKNRSTVLEHTSRVSAFTDFLLEVVFKNLSDKIKLECYRFAIFHDSIETHTNDIPHTVKVQNPDFYKAVKDLEEKLCPYKISNIAALIVKCADVLDFCYESKLEIITGNICKEYSTVFPKALVVMENLKVKNEKFKKEIVLVENIIKTIFSDKDYLKF